MMLAKARIINYNCNCSFIVLATVITIVNYDCHLFLVQATELFAAVLVISLLGGVRVCCTTAFVVFAGVLVSWNVEKMRKEFFFLLILLSAGAYGFFISLDLFDLKVYHGNLLC